ncbi:MAG: CopG family transcriptional regulator [Planctomycetes bacterium]|nr:CopG family transcriptional regulator [Planctomycetota bacterium]
MTLTVRLNAESQATLDRLARRRGVSKSEVVRQALATLVRVDATAAAPPRRLSDEWAHLIGCVRGGDPDLSERTGEKLRQLLARRRARR